MFAKTKQYIKLLHAEEIIRRYFIINSFDGILTTLGILIGGFIASATTREIILMSVAAGLSMLVSGVAGVFLSEKAERERSIKDLEKALLKKLDKSLFKKASSSVILVVSLVDGFSPLLSVLIIISPFFIFKQPICFFASTTIAFITLFILGTYLGKVSKKNVLISGVQMLLAGLAAVAVLMVLKAF